MKIVSERDENGCLVVVSHSLDRYGYPRVTRRGIEHTAHRVIWMEEFGEIPPSTYVCHKCDNRRCVNKDHLFLGTMYDNINDMIAKKRHTHGERNGCHRLTEEEVVDIYKSPIRNGLLAKKYGVSERQVYYIKEKKRWKILLEEL